MYIDPLTSQRYAFAPTRWRGDDGALLDLDFAPPALDWDRVRARPPGLWRYREVLPVAPATEPVTLGEGFTPIVPLALDDGAPPLLLKQDQLFPSGSYKDRGATVMVTVARERGIARLVQDSSGNTGCAVATYCARAGIACTVFVPADTAPSKLVQMRAAGAEVVLVPGARADAARAAHAAAGQTFYASHCWNPLFLHGTKTVAYELYEQTVLAGEGALPDALALPAGNGTLLLGAALGFAELARAGAIARSPRLFAVQAAACDPVYRAFHGLAPRAALEPTLAEGIAIAEPPRLAQMVAAVRASGGGVVAVSEAQIHDAALALARRGFYVEPTTAATIAGVPQIRATLPPGARVLAVLTGHGLKATDKLGKMLAGRA